MRVFPHFVFRASGNGPATTFHAGAGAGGTDTPPVLLNLHRSTDLSSPDRRLAIGTAVTDAHEKHMGVLMAVIDGVADLCLDLNDAREAFGLVSSRHTAAEIERDTAERPAALPTPPRPQLQHQGVTLAEKHLRAGDIAAGGWDLPQ